MHIFSQEDKYICIEYYGERETAGARKRVEDAETGVPQVQEETRKAENTGLTNREPEDTFQEMMVAIGNSLSDLSSSEAEEDVEDENDEETELSQLSEDDEPGWVMGTITNTVQQHMERFRQKRMKVDESTPPGWEDAADHFCESNEKLGASALRVPAVVQAQTDDHATAPAPITIGELMVCLHILPGISGMQQGTSPP